MSRTNNKRSISTFNFGYPHLTLKEGPKFKLDHIRRFRAHDFLYVGFILQTSRTNNKHFCNSFQVTTELLNSKNVKVAITPLCNELQVCNFTML